MSSTSRRTTRRCRASRRGCSRASAAPTRPTPTTCRPRPSATPPSASGGGCRSCRRSPPMLAKAVKGIAALDGQDVSFEPKWDGFRSIVFRSGDLVEIGSRNEKPMTRYFPEVVEAALANLPERCVVDGEIIVVRPGEDRLDFDLLSQRIHPAASRVKKLSVETPARFVAFDLLALGDDDLTGRPFRERRALLEQALADAEAPIHLTPATTDRDGRGRLVHRVRGRRPRRARRQAARRPLRARQAHDGQDQARAHRRLRRRGLPHPQDRRRPHRVAAPRHPRRRRPAALGRRHRRVPHGPAQGAVRGAAAPRHRRSRTTRGTGRRRRRAPAPRRPRRGAAGPPARTCRSRRCAPSGSSRCATTTWRASASGTPPSSCAGGPTRTPRTAPSSSWRSRSPTTSPRCSSGGAA